MAEELIELYKIEHLYADISRGYHAAMLIYSVQGDKAQTMRYMKETVEAIVAHSRPSHPLLPELYNVLQAPAKHYSWLYKHLK